jgi:hypothetical protein
VALTSVRPRWSREVAVACNVLRRCVRPEGGDQLVHHSSNSGRSRGGKRPSGS